MDTMKKRVGWQRKIKVLHLITRLDKGGSAENTLLTALGLDKNRYEVLLAKGPSTESKMGFRERMEVDKSLQIAQSDGVGIINIPKLMRRIDLLYDFISFIKILKIIRSEKPQIVHTHTSKAGLLGRLAAFVAKTPIIIHTPHGHIFYGYFGRVTSYLFVLIEKLLAKITDKIISLTNQEGLDHVRLNIACPEKFISIHSGVDIQRFISAKSGGDGLKASFGIMPQSLVVGTIGRLVPIKGHEYLIEAAPKILKEVPGVKFVLVGDGNLRPKLERLTNALNVQDAFLFLHWRSDIPKIIRMFDLFTLPSLNEGMGKVLVEAMAAGKAIVASNTGGIPDLVVHAHNGLLVPPGNPSRLAEAIVTLLKDSNKRQEMGENGKLLAQRYSVESMVNKTETLYEELLAKNGYLQA